MKGENEGAKYDYLNENQDNPTITKLKQYTTLVLIYLYVQYINTGATQLQLAVEHTRMYRTKSTSICALKHDFPIMTLCAVTNGNQLQIQERTYAKSSSLCGKFSFVEGGFHDSAAHNHHLYSSAPKNTASPHAQIKKPKMPQVIHGGNRIQLYLLNSKRERFDYMRSSLLNSDL